MGKNGNVVRDVYSAFAEGDVAAILAALDPKVQWREAENFLYADGNPYVGPQAVLQDLFQRVASDIENIAAVPEHLVEAGDTVVVEGRYRGKVKATGKLVDAQFAHVWNLRDGKIIDFQQYTDTKQWADAAKS